MNRFLEKLKPVFLLMGMTLVSLLVVYLVNFSSPAIDSAEIQSLEEFSWVGGETEILIVEDTSVPTQEVVIEGEGEVKGFLDNPLYTCTNKEGSYFTKIESEAICELQGDIDINFSEDSGGVANPGGKYVSRNAELILSIVTVPLDLQSGVEVADSNRMITSDTPTLKPAGEQIDSKTANMLLPPGQQANEYLEWDEDLPFKVEYLVGFGESLLDSLGELLGGGEGGWIGVEDEIPNGCGEEQYNNMNPSNVNPDKSNRISQFMQDSLYRYPGETDTIVKDEIIDVCDNVKDTYTIWEEEIYESCKINDFIKVVEKIKKAGDWLDFFENWLKCGGDNPDPEYCIKTENIVVLMDSEFGSDIDCLKGSACTNTFMSTRNSVASAPGVDLGGKQYYLTPCEAFIEGIYGTADIYCAWDMSHMFKERKFNEFDDFPVENPTPTDEQYQEFLEDYVQGRDGVEEIQPGN